MTQETINLIDSIQVNFNGGMGVLNIVLALVMYGVALGIKPRLFVEVFSKPKGVILGALCQLFLLPLFTFLLALALGGSISWSMALGMILVAACPGGNISNFMTSLSKGNIELAVSLTAISTALAIFTTPFNFWLFGNLYLKYADVAAAVPHITIPLGEVFKTIVLILGIPLVLGVLTSQYLPKFADKLKKPFQWISLVFFIGMVVVSFAGNMDNFMKCIKIIFIIVFVHNLLALGIGFSVGTIFKVPVKDRRTLTIETGIQNSGLGLVLMLGTPIFANVFGGVVPGGMLVITAWWGVWHIISGLCISLIFNRHEFRKPSNG